MKTHELAKALRALAFVLEKGPNTQVENARIAPEGISGAQLAISLSTLTELSRVDKQQWIAFIKDLAFPIDVRPRDASRDILGKLLAYLESNTTAREQLKKASFKESQASPELMRAFSSLLKDIP